VIAHQPKFHVISRHAGFSLIEVAVVLIIITVLFALLAAPLSGQIESRRYEETRKLLETGKEALLGFAVANGRLPCPASAASNGVESYWNTTADPTPVAPPGPAQIAHGKCTNQFDGFLPAVTLGLTPVDANGYLIDSWPNNAASRVRYAVSADTALPDPPGTTSYYSLTSLDGIKNRTMAQVTADKNLVVCSTGATAAPSSTACNAPTQMLASGAAAVLFSTGSNGGTPVASLSFDEQNNQNGDKTFSSGTPTANFDDVVTWLSMNTLFGRMVQAGKLP
jgi:prepilin-type N-terminal cleavage/methylation domain-containing protein